MNLSRNGKVARLPRAVRNELNERLADGETARSVVGWLNELPVVQGIVAREFGGRAIREQNVSEWKRGGYEDWVLEQEARGMVERFAEGRGRENRRGAEGWERVAEGRPDSAESEGGGGADAAPGWNKGEADEAELREPGRVEAGASARGHDVIQDAMPDGRSGEPDGCDDSGETGGSLTEALVWWVTARLAVEMRAVGRLKKSSERWRVFGAMCDRVVKLRRGDQQERRLKVAQRRLEDERARKKKVTEEEMMAWAMEEKNRAKIAKGYVSRAEKIAFLNKNYFADVDAEPEPEIFVRERREKAVELAKAQVGEDDPGFEWYVEELVWRLKREDEARCARRLGGEGEGVFSHQKASDQLGGAERVGDSGRPTVGSGRSEVAKQGVAEGNGASLGREGARGEVGLIRRKPETEAEYAARMEGHLRMIRRAGPGERKGGEDGR